MKEKALHSKEAMRGRNTCLQVLDVNWPAEMAAERQNQKPMEGAQSYLTSENFSVKGSTDLNRHKNSRGTEEPSRFTQTKRLPGFALRPKES